MIGHVDAGAGRVVLRRSRHHETDAGGPEDQPRPDARDPDEYRNTREEQT